MGLPENYGRLTERSEVYVSNPVSVGRTKCSPCSTRREKGVDQATWPVDRSVSKKAWDILPVAYCLSAFDPQVAQMPDNLLVGKVIGEFHKKGKRLVTDY
jgi:hypothetical protein